MTIATSRRLRASSLWRNTWGPAERAGPLFLSMLPVARLLQRTLPAPSATAELRAFLIAPGSLMKRHLLPAFLCLFVLAAACGPGPGSGTDGGRPPTPGPTAAPPMAGTDGGTEGTAAQRRRRGGHLRQRRGRGRRAVRRRQPRPRRRLRAGLHPHRRRGGAVRHLGASGLGHLPGDRRRRRRAPRGRRPHPRPHLPGRAGGRGRHRDHRLRGLQLRRRGPRGHGDHLPPRRHLPGPHQPPRPPHLHPEPAVHRHRRALRAAP